MIPTPHRLRDTAAALINCLYDELVSNYVDRVQIRLNSPVSIICCSPQQFQESNKEQQDHEIKFYDAGVEVETSNSEKILHFANSLSRFVEVRTAEGDVFSANGLVVAVPLNSLASLSWRPPIHDSIKLAGEKCNPADSQRVKTWALVKNIASDVDRVTRIHWLENGRVDESLIIHRHLGEIRAMRGEQDDRFQKLKYAVSQSMTMTSSREVKKKNHGVTSEFSTSNIADSDSALLALYSPQSYSSKMNIKHRLKMHHPYLDVIDYVSHDFGKDPWSRGGSLALRAGTSVLYTEAAAQAAYPYSSDKRAMCIGADLSNIWCSKYSVLAVYSQY